MTAYLAGSKAWVRALSGSNLHALRISLERSAITHKSTDEKSGEEEDEDEEDEEEEEEDEFAGDGEESEEEKPKKKTDEGVRLFVAGLAKNHSLRELTLFPAYYRSPVITVCLLTRMHDRSMYD